MSDEQLSVVYVLTNSAMPGLVKIGQTSLYEHATRVSQLYTTGVPVPFDIEYACKVPNPAEVETALHEAFAPARVNPRREFFRIDPEQVIAILRLLDVEDATEEVKADSEEGIDAQDKQAAERLRSRRPNLNFEEMGIPNGATLTSTKTDDTATVVGPRKVEFRDHDEISLTGATREMLEIEHSVSPSSLWLYEGKSLKDIYGETYSDV